MRSRKDRTRCSRVGGSGEPNISARLNLRLYSVATHLHCDFGVQQFKSHPADFGVPVALRKLVFCQMGYFRSVYCHLKECFQTPTETHQNVESYTMIYASLQICLLAASASRSHEVRCLNICWCNAHACWKYRRCRHQKKKQHLNLKIHHMLQRDIKLPHGQLHRENPYNPDEK